MDRSDCTAYKARGLGGGRLRVGKTSLEMISSVQVTMWHPLHDISAPRLREAVDECSCLRVRPPPHCERERADLAHSMKIEIKDLISWEGGCWNGTCGGRLNRDNTDWIK